MKKPREKRVFSLNVRVAGGGEGSNRVPFAVDHLENVMERKHSTIQDYRGHLRRHLVPFFGERPIDKIDPAHVLQYLKRKRDEGLSSKTVQNHLNFLHGIFSFAIKRGWAQSNPVALVDRPKKNRSPHQRVRFLQSVELDALIDTVPEDTLGAVERTLYLAAALTGLRQGELLALKWLDIDLSPTTSRAVGWTPRSPTKAARSRWPRGSPATSEPCTMTPATKAMGELVFCHPETGHVFDPSKMRKRFKDALARASVREITFHELRHTFGTQMAAAGAPLRAIQEWMGHADAKTTEIYRHYAPDPTHGAAFVDRAFGGREDDDANGRDSNVGARR
jgi:integrase